MRSVGQLAFLVLAPWLALTGQTIPQRRGISFGTFSSLHYVDEGAGDLIGAELMVLPNMNSAYVVFQCAEGVPSEPVLVPAKVSGKRLEFTVSQREGTCNGDYVGEASARGMMLKRSGAERPEFLLRKKSYWAE